MLAIDETAAHLSHSQGAYFDGSLELLRELAVTIDVDAALPRLSAIVSKMLPHDALRMVCLDQQGRPIVNASTADLPDMMAADADEVIIGDLRSEAPGGTAAPHAMKRLVGDGYRSVLGVSTLAPEPLVRVAFWSKQPLAFNRAHVPLARRIAYHLGLGTQTRTLGRTTPSDRRRPGGTGRRARAASGRTGDRRAPTCASSASLPNGAGCCARQRRSPRRTRPCW